MSDYSELKKLAEAATPGDWQVIETELPCRLGLSHIERRIFTAKDHPQLKAPYPVVSGSVALGTDETPVHHMVSIRSEDAAFIAAANPAAVLAMIAENEHLIESRGEAREDRNKIGDRYDQLKAENEALRKDADRYRFLKSLPMASADDEVDAAMSKGDKA